MCKFLDPSTPAVPAGSKHASPLHEVVMEVQGCIVLHLRGELPPYRYRNAAMTKGVLSSSTQMTRLPEPHQHRGPLTGRGRDGSGQSPLMARDLRAAGTTGASGAAEAAAHGSMGIAKAMLASNACSFARPATPVLLTFSPGKGQEGIAVRRQRRQVMACTGAAPRMLLEKTASMQDLAETCTGYCAAAASAGPGKVMN